MTNGGIPAGWYDDPSGQGGYRWWDGVQWTEHTDRSVAAASTPPAQEAGPAVAAGWYDDPSGQGGYRWWDGAQWTDHTHPPASAEPTAVDPAPVEPSPTDPDTSPEHEDGAGPAAPGSDGWVSDEPAVSDGPVAPNEVVGADVPVSPAPETAPEGDAPEQGRTPEPVPAEVPAGWYEDPSGRVGYRWWDGARWTEHTHGSAAPVAPDHATGSAAAEREVEAEHVPEADEGAGSEPGAAAEDEVAAGEPVAAEEPREAASATESGEAASSTVPTVAPGWYPDPAGGGQRWWTGEAWSDHVRADARPEPDPSSDQGATADPAGSSGTSPDATAVMPPIEEPTQPAAATSTPATSASPGTSGGGFTMAGVGHRPAPGTPPDDGDGDGGGSRKVVVVLVLLVLLLALAGVAVWLFTDVFGDDPEPAAAVASEEASSEEPEETPSEGSEEAAEETVSEGGPYDHVSDVDLATQTWFTDCIGTSEAPDERVGDPERVRFDDPQGRFLTHRNPHASTGYPYFEVNLGSIQYGDVTGDGVDDAVLDVYCDEGERTESGFAVWTLDTDGSAQQLATPDFRLDLDLGFVVEAALEEDRLTISYVEEVEGEPLERREAHVYEGGNWRVEDETTDVASLPVQDEAIAGVAFASLDETWSYAPRSTHSAPLIATSEAGETFVIALDESLLGMAGPGLDPDDLVDEWLLVLEDLEAGDQVEPTGVDLEGARSATRLTYEHVDAEINYYALIAEVDGLVVEISVQVDDEIWTEEGTLDEIDSRFESFSFDPDLLLAAYAEG